MWFKADIRGYNTTNNKKENQCKSSVSRNAIQDMVEYLAQTLTPDYKNVVNLYQNTTLKCIRLS